MHSREKFFQNIVGFHFQAGCVDARVTAEILVLHHILVDEQLHAIVRVIHKPQDSDGAGGQVKKLLHVFF